MPRLHTLLATTAFTLLLAPAAAWANHDLIISEYVEGSSNNKALEIYNPTGAAVDLSNYQVRIYFNGSSTVGNTIALAGLLAAGDVYVVAHSSAAAAILAVADQTTGSLTFNGNDAVELVTAGAGTKIDVIGQIGFDPGAEWGAGLQSTANNTIQRNATVCEGDTNGSDVFDPATEWTGFAQDTFSGLGSHQSGCGPTPTLNSTWGTIKAMYR